VNSPARTISWLIGLFFRMLLLKWLGPIHCSRDKGKQGPFQRLKPPLASRNPLAQRVLGMRCQQA
jgi:hypothetical protein